MRLQRLRQHTGGSRRSSCLACDYPRDGGPSSRSAQRRTSPTPDQHAENAADANRWIQSRMPNRDATDHSMTSVPLDDEVIARLAVDRRLPIDPHTEPIAVHRNGADRLVRPAARDVQDSKSAHRASRAERKLALRGQKPPGRAQRYRLYTARSLQRSREPRVDLPSAPDCAVPRPRACSRFPAACSSSTSVCRISSRTRCRAPAVWAFNFSSAVLGKRLLGLCRFHEQPEFHGVRLPCSSPPDDYQRSKPSCAAPCHARDDGPACDRRARTLRKPSHVLRVAPRICDATSAPRAASGRRQATRRQSGRDANFR